MRFKKLSPSRLYCSKRLEQMCWRLRLCSFCHVWTPTLQQLCGTQECHALKNRPYLDWCPVVTCFLLLSLLSVRIVALASSSFSSVVDVDGRHERSASITLVRPFLNISIHSYTLHSGNALSQYWVHKRAWISAPLTPSAHRNLMTFLCSSLAQTERHANMFTAQ